jgi:hypothetical protein
MKIERFEDIEAWQLARELTRKVYCLRAGQANTCGHSWIYQLSQKI